MESTKQTWFYWQVQRSCCPNHQKVKDLFFCIFRKKSTTCAFFQEWPQRHHAISVFISIRSWFFIISLFRAISFLSLYLSSFLAIISFLTFHFYYYYSSVILLFSFIFLSCFLFVCYFALRLKLFNLLLFSWWVSRLL